MAEKVSYRFPEELMAKVKEEAKRQKLSASKVVQIALSEYFNRDQPRQNFEQIIYEIAKTRSTIVRCTGTKGELMCELLEEAGRDAQEYVATLRNGGEPS